MHGHGSTRADRVRPKVFWGESESGRAHLTDLGPEDRDNVKKNNGVEYLARGRIFGLGVAPSNGHVGPGTHKLGLFRYEGGMDIGEQDQLKG